LSEGDLAVVNADQTRPLRDEQKAPGRRIEYIFSYLRGEEGTRTKGSDSDAGMK
jgi:hypothetical protein